MRVLVCGGRNYSNERCCQRVLGDLQYMHEFKPMTIIHGGARGADNLAARWAYDNKVPVEVYSANWNLHGKAAGAIRNQEMLKTGIDLVIAFPGGRGTAHMKTIARKAGVEVREIE
jgi:hypothetical protein